MNYIHNTTKEQKTHRQLKIDSPTVSIAQDGTEIIMNVWYLIHTDEKPVYDAYTEKVVEVEPVFTTVYTQTWSIVALTQQELDDNLAAAKVSQEYLIVEDHVVQMFTSWNVTELFEYTKRRTDVNARISELQDMVRTPEQDIELEDYKAFFEYDKLLNSEEYDFREEVNALLLIADVESYTWSYTVPVTTTGPLTDSQFFVKYGFEQNPVVNVQSQQGYDGTYTVGQGSSAKVVRVEDGRTISVV